MKRTRNQFRRAENQFHIYLSISYLFKSLTFFHAFFYFFFQKRNQTMNITFWSNRNYLYNDNLFNFEDYILTQGVI